MSKALREAFYFDGIYNACKEIALQSVIERLLNSELDNSNLSDEQIDQAFDVAIGMIPNEDDVWLVVQQFISTNATEQDIKKFVAASKKMYEIINEMPNVMLNKMIPVDNREKEVLNG